MNNDVSMLYTNVLATPKNPCIYFQIISKSSWERYRTEGIAYQYLPISRPNCYLYDLSCYRFDPGECSGKLRRYFIGDAYNYRDVRWVGLPTGQCDVSLIGRVVAQCSINFIYRVRWQKRTRAIIRNRVNNLDKRSNPSIFN